MLGLIKKDLLLIKANLKTLVVIFAVFILMAFQGTMDMTFIIPMMSVMLFIATFSYDDYNNWNAYAITLPNGRKNVVKSKYTATIIMLFITSIFSLIISFLVMKVNDNSTSSTMIESLVGSVFGIGIVISLMYPLIFKLGVEKGRIWMFVIIFVFVGLGGLIFSAIDLKELAQNFKFIENLWYIFLPLLFVIILFISYKISEHIYLKREF